MASSLTVRCSPLAANRGSPCSLPRRVWCGNAGCGENENLTLYAELLQKSVDPRTGKQGGVLIENCHWGLCAATRMGPSGHLDPRRNYMRSRDNASCPTLDFCPYNTYRISGDINNDSGVLPDPCHKLP